MDVHRIVPRYADVRAQPLPAIAFPVRRLRSVDAPRPLLVVVFVFPAFAAVPTPRPPRTRLRRRRTVHRRGEVLERLVDFRERGHVFDRQRPDVSVAARRRHLLPGKASVLVVEHHDRPDGRREGRRVRHLVQRQRRRCLVPPLDVIIRALRLVVVQQHQHPLLIHRRRLLVHLHAGFHRERPGRPVRIGHRQRHRVRPRRLVVPSRFRLRAVRLPVPVQIPGEARHFVRRFLVLQEEAHPQRGRPLGREGVERDILPHLQVPLQRLAPHFHRRLALLGQHPAPCRHTRSHRPPRRHADELEDPLLVRGRLPHPLVPSRRRQHELQARHPRPLVRVHERPRPVHAPAQHQVHLRLPVLLVHLGLGVAGRQPASRLRRHPNHSERQPSELVASVKVGGCRHNVAVDVFRIHRQPLFRRF